MVKPVKNISFRTATYPDVLALANKLAILEKRKPLDAIRQLILRFGPIRIQELEKPSQPAEPAEI